MGYGIWDMGYGIHFMCYVLCVAGNRELSVVEMLHDRIILEICPVS